MECRTHNIEIVTDTDNVRVSVIGEKNKVAVCPITHIAAMGVDVVVVKVDPHRF
jgi:hypothetical protein